MLERPVIRGMSVKSLMRVGGFALSSAGSPRPIDQPLPAWGYVILSLVSLGICSLAGWYLLNLGQMDPVTAGRAYYVLLALLGLASAAFLFGVMRSTATLVGKPFGLAIDLGGPAAIAAIVVAGGFLAVEPPKDFVLVIRMRSSEPIKDTSDAWIQIDLGQRRDKRPFNSGEAMIPSVPAQFRRAELPMVFESQQYRLREAKPAFKVTEDAVIYLDVVPIGKKVEESPKKFVHATGSFERNGNTWIEYHADKYGYFRFTESGVTGGYVYLVDTTRVKDNDPNRPMYLRLPLSGGMAQWSYPNPFEWRDLYFVNPQY